MKDVNAEQDERLLALIAKKSDADLERLYHKYGRWVYSLCLSMLRDKSESEEVTQETFLKIWNNAEKYDRIKGTGSCWIMTIARRCALDRLRSSRSLKRQAQARVDCEFLDHKNNPALSDHDGIEVIYHKEEIELIKDALNSLTDEEKSIIQSAYFEGLTQNQIAMALGISKGTVKTRLRRSVNKIKKILGHKLKL